MVKERDQAGIDQRQGYGMFLMSSGAPEMHDVSSVAMILLMATHLPSCAGYLGHPFKNRHIAHDGTGLFADYVKCEYNQRGPFRSYFQTTRLILGRRGLIRAKCIHLHQATRLFQLSRAPRTYFMLD
jgi:hypothetical protein